MIPSGANGSKNRSSRTVLIQRRRRSSIGSRPTTRRATKKRHSIGRDGALRRPQRKHQGFLSAADAAARRPYQGHCAREIRFRDAMGISLKPQHLNRYRQIAWLFVKYGRSDLVKETGLDGTLPAEQRVTPKEAAQASELPQHLETLGPTPTKLGNLHTTRAERMPSPTPQTIDR